MTEEGRYKVGSLLRPTPVPGCARSTLSQERVFLLLLFHHFLLQLASAEEEPADGEEAGDTGNA